MRVSHGDQLQGVLMFMGHQMGDVVLVCGQQSGPLYQRSVALARDLDCPLVSDLSEYPSHNPPPTWQLYLSDCHLSLASQQYGIAPVWVDFVKGKAGYRLAHGGLNQAIVKACGIRAGQTPVILDATAGFGYDAFVLASMGARVICVEQSPLVFCLLHDGVLRARQHPVTDLISQRVELHQGNALDFLHQTVDVIYLDPMFEPRKKQKALNNKKMQVLARLLGNDGDNNDQLLLKSLDCAPKVVVKRARHASFLANLKPHHQLIGKANRFDVYMGSSSPVALV